MGWAAGVVFSSGTGKGGVGGGLAKGECGGQGARLGPTGAARGRHYDASGGAGIAGARDGGGKPWGGAVAVDWANQAALIAGGTQVGLVITATAVSKSRGIKKT